MNGEYSVLFLGKNGEPQLDKLVNASFEHRVIGNKSVHLITDKDGAIYLGALQDITKVTVDAKAMRVGASWFLSV